MPQHRNSSAAPSHPPHARPSSFPAFASNQREARFARWYRIMFALGLALTMMFGCSEAYSQSTTKQFVAPGALAAPFAAFVAEASRRFGIPAAWIRAVMHAESFGDVRAISPKGAMGLMQIMPDTWAELASALSSRH